MNTIITLSVDMRLLAYSSLLCIVMWVPYVLIAIKTLGLKNLAQQLLGKVLILLFCYY